MLEQFKALITEYKYLKDDIDNICEDPHGNLVYTYNGFMDCVVIVQNGRYGDIGDVNRNAVKNNPDVELHRARWFDSLKELVATVASEVDPDFLPTA